jgi:hypothetical protein
MGFDNMEIPRIYEAEPDEVASAVLRERELNETLCYLERAISRIASREAPSRWQSSHAGPRRSPSPTRGLGSLLHRCVTIFGTGRHTPARFTTGPSH